MTKTEELERAVAALSEADYTRFRRWFLEADWRKWDRQMEADSADGKLDFLLAEAADARKQKRLTRL